MATDSVLIVWSNPKDALCGGRTGLSCCYYKAEQDEFVDYIDFTSPQSTSMLRIHWVIQPSSKIPLIKTPKITLV